MVEAGIQPDQWQADLLRSTCSDILMLCARQRGKSLVAAALALAVAFTRPPALVLLLCPTLRQSGELFKEKLLGLYDRLHRPIPATQETALTLTLANGSRIISLPSSEKNIRGYSSVALLVVDEAARVPDELYNAIRPMLAVSAGRLIALSTPFGRRGWFYNEWHSSNNWYRARVTAENCPRIPAGFLAQERRSLGERWYRQEYLCSFEDAIGQIFASELLERAMASELEAFDI